MGNEDNPFSDDFSGMYEHRRRVEAAHGQREGLVKHREDVKDKIVDHKDMEKGGYVDKEATVVTGDSRFFDGF